jgi:two-component system NtrC family response regulator
VLDEVALLPLESQAKLLRVLESGAVRRLGSSSERRVDVRFLATTNADLEGAMERGSFRRDLYYRLAGVVLEVPPLRGRTGDVALLSRHFLELHARRLDRPAPVLERDALDLLEGREWPGNVRELEFFLLGVLVRLPDEQRISARDLATAPSQPAPREPDEISVKRSLSDLRRDLERKYLSRLFLELEGDIPRMLEHLGVKQSKLYGWLRSLGLDIRELRRRLEERKGPRTI